MELPNGVRIDHERDATAYSVSVETTLVGYSTAASTTASVAANATTRICADPVPNLTTLYALSASAATSINSTVRNTANQMSLTADSKSVTVLPGKDIVWDSSNLGLTANDHRDLSAVFTIPNHPSVQTLLASVANRSVFVNQFGNDPYARGVRNDTFPIDVDAIDTEMSFFLPNESITWSLPAVDGGNEDDIDLYIFRDDQFLAWINGTGGTATAVAADQTSGSSGTFTAPAAGWYVTVLYNPDTNATRVVTFERTATRERIVRDVLEATFEEMKVRGMAYETIPSTYFTGTQRIKRVDQVLSSQLANPIEGALLFASIAEAIGMDAVLVYRTGHAYVAIRDAPGSGFMWPIETTTVSSSDFYDAYFGAITSFYNEQANDPNFHLVDIKTARSRMLAPMPQ